MSNKTIATDKDGKAPFIVGDLKEAVILWDRKQLSIDMTKEGGNAWRTNTSEFRAIEREDVTLWTKKQLCMGKLRLRLKQGLNKVGGVLLGTNSRGSKKYLRVDGDEEDDLITSFVVATEIYIKNATSKNVDLKASLLN